MILVAASSRSRAASAIAAASRAICCSRGDFGGLVLAAAACWATARSTAARGRQFGPLRLARRLDRVLDLGIGQHLAARSALEDRGAGLGGGRRRSWLSAMGNFC
jgi:hypothetical protein